MENWHIDADQEYGTGTEISVTDILIYGLLSFWVYTVYKFNKLFKDHVNNRKSYFDRATAPDNTSPEYVKIFTVNKKQAILPICLYSICMVFFLAVMVFTYLTLWEYPKYFIYWKDGIPPVTGLMFLLFSSASIFFMYSMMRSIRDHEYGELTLYCRTVGKSSNLTSLKTMFVQRWNNYKNQIALFCIVTVSITITPYYATRHFRILLDSGGDFDTYLYIWSGAIVLGVFVFHYFGVRILKKMFNGHLEAESLYRGRISENIDSALVSASQQRTEDDLSGPGRALAAIMLTDIVGYSKMMETSEQAAYKTLLVHNAIIRQHITRNNGVEVKTIGDAFLVRFSSAVDAVRSAMDIQKEFNQSSRADADGGNIKVRIGIHVGDVLLTDNDMFGDSVNIASRIQPIAEPGGICITADVYNIIKKTLDIKVVNLGIQDLKNIKMSPEIYKIIIDAVQKQ